MYLSNLKYWHFVSHLRLELHLLSVVELKQEVGGKTAVKALKKDLPFKSENFLFGTRFTFLTLNFEGGESLVDDLAAGEGGRLARGHDLQRQVSKRIKTLLSPGRHKPPPASRSRSPRCKTASRSPWTTLAWTLTRTCRVILLLASNLFKLTWAQSGWSLLHFSTPRSRCCWRTNGTWRRQDRLPPGSREVTNTIYPGIFPMLICFHQRVQKWMLLALFAITSSLLSYLAVDGDGDCDDDDNHDDHHHHNSSIILTWQVMVLGCLKLIPSIFGPGKERQRGATGENGGFVFWSFPFHFAIPIPSSGYLCAFSLYQKYSFTIDVHVFLKYCAKSDYSRANSIWGCQSVSRGLFYNLISHSYTKCFFYKGFFSFTLAREKRFQDKARLLQYDDDDEIDSISLLHCLFDVKL